jgi:deferrochelatase/peroxidase EfeB
MRDGNEFDFGDLQGLVHFAHGKMVETSFLLLKIRDSARAREWLAQAPVSAAVEAPEESRPEAALHIAFTAAGLENLGVNGDVIAGFSEEFLSGMTSASRARRLGDTGDNAPEHWEWGGRAEDTPDVLLMLYAVENGLDEWTKRVACEPFDEAFTLYRRLPTNANVSAEPFGFSDGISQPTIDWHRRQSTDAHRRDEYSNLLAAGEVVLGYPNEYGLYTDRPLLNPADDELAAVLPDAEDEPGAKDLGRNGCYLILRQLRQDVVGFWKFVDRAADGDAASRSRLAAAMVGRERDGTPLMPTVKGDVEGTPEKLSRLNEFNYAADPKGQVCPIGAHVRRANPRTGDFPPGVSGPLSRTMRTLGLMRRSPTDDLVASTRFHRLIRRGRPYGPPLDPDRTLAVDNDREERGLQFICLCANISRQFEFVQNAWIVNSKFDGLENESDPLLGNRLPLADGSPTDNLSRPQFSGPCRRLAGLPRFVTVCGGAYFFLPGLRALKYIAGSPGADR